jgi:hypothetical protein
VSRTLAGVEKDSRKVFGSFQLGYLAPLGTERALGGGVFMGGNIEEDWWTGLLVRYRQALGSRWSLGLGAGLAPWVTERLGRPIVSAEAVLSPAEWIGVILELHSSAECHTALGPEVQIGDQIIQTPFLDCRDTRLAPSVGLQLGDKPGLVSGIVAGILVVIAVTGELSPP